MLEQVQTVLLVGYLTIVGIQTVLPVGYRTIFGEVVAYFYQYKVKLLNAKVLVIILVFVIQFIT